MTLKCVTLAAAMFAGLLGGTAHAATNLVSNGSFENSSYTQSSEFGVATTGSNPNFTATQGVTDWTATLKGGYSHYWFAKNATTVSALNRFGSNSEKLATSFTGSSPDGGNFIGLDGDYQGDGLGAYNSPFVQQISGLVVGQVYTLSFYWAATQLQSRHGQTTNKLIASLGNETYSTANLTVGDQGFSGWRQQNFNYTATSTSQALTFLAYGGPAGLPPYALLDGVSLTAAVPEPAMWAMMLVGFGVIGASARRRSARDRALTA